MAFRINLNMAPSFPEAPVPANVPLRTGFRAPVRSFVFLRTVTHSPVVLRGTR